MKPIQLIFCTLLAFGGLTFRAEAKTWARAKQLSRTQNVVLIDISEQQMYVLKNNQALLTSGVVTGKTETPTDLGEFKVTYKQRGATLQSPGYAAKKNAGTLSEDDYSVRVEYWMPYNRGEGLHDAWWRASDEFGQNGRNWIEGSHGCTNLPTDVAARLYDLIVPGTPVVVVP